MRNIATLLLVFFTLLSAAHAQDVAITYYVNDYASIFTPDQVQTLEQILINISQSGAAEYAIVTVDTTGEVPIEEYAINLAQGKLGDTEKDNGLLLLIAVSDKKYRFEVGSGLEGTLTDARVGGLGRKYLVPYFRQEDYGGGVIAVSAALQDILVNGNTAEIAVAPEGSPLWILLIIAIIILIVLFAIAYSQRKKHGKYYDAALAAANIASASDWWRRGGGSGGFGGFGGGSFGGGGASGGW